MTCIFALATGDYAIMAADRQIVDGWVSHEAREPKIVRKGPWLLGTTGPLRVNNAVKHGFIPPLPPDGPLNERWIFSTFVPALRRHLGETEMALIEGWIGGKENEQQATILVACPGTVFTIQADWAVDVWREQYAAIGTGERYALSAWFGATNAQTVARNDWVDRRTVLGCVMAADKFDIYTGGQIDVICTEDLQVGEPT